MTSRSSSVGADPPLQRGGYINRRPEISFVPSENITQFFPTIQWSRKDPERPTDSISNVGAMTEPINRRQTDGMSNIAMTEPVIMRQTDGISNIAAVTESIIKRQTHSRSNIAMTEPIVKRQKDSRSNIAMTEPIVKRQKDSRSNIAMTEPIIMRQTDGIRNIAAVTEHIIKRQKDSRSNVAITEPIINLGENATENASVNPDYERSANITVADVVTPDPGEDLRVGDRDLLEGDGSGSDPPLPHLSEVAVERVATRGSQVYWGSEDGVVHMGMRPIHRPRKQLRHVAETTTQSTPGYEEARTHLHSTTSTPEIQDLSSIMPTQSSTLGYEETRPRITSTPEIQDSSSIMPTQSSTLGYEETRPHITSTPEIQELSSIMPTQSSTLGYEETRPHITSTPEIQDLSSIMPTQSSTLGYEETRPHITSTPEIQELSSVLPDVWATDVPETEAWTAETPKESLMGAPEERLTNNIEDENTERTENQLAFMNEEESMTTPEGLSSTEPKELFTITPEGLSTTEPKELFTITPEEYLTTVAPEEWPSTISTTLQEEDDWLTLLPQEEEEEELMGTQDEALSFYPMPSLSPTPPSVTPTLPPSLPPTPSPQDAIEDTFRITTRGLDFLLEASPTGQSSLDSTEFPKDYLFTLDLAITTTREGLMVDDRDVTFDPSQIAKATSYEGSSYPTATRSATVTTTWVDEDRPVIPGHQNNSELVNPSSVREVSSTSSIDSQDTEGEDMEASTTSTLAMGDELMPMLNGVHRNSQVSNSSVTLTHPPTTEERDVENTTQSGNIEDREVEANSTQAPKLTFTYETNQTNSSGRSLSDFPVLMTNITDARSDNSSVVRSDRRDNKTEETVVYEMPVVTRNAGPQLSPTVVVALSVCCAVVVVLAALSVALWVCRRHRNRSKIYLSQEAAKPRAFFTRPMNPAVLPEDSDREDAVYMFEFQRPRPPILLGDDQRGIYFIKRDEECIASVGVENEAFTDIPLGETETGDEGGTKLDPPKYDLRSKQDDADSGIRVWSSTGSLHAAASPLPTHCRVPPPPYSPAITRESVCLTVHSLPLPPLPKSSRIFDV